MLNKSWEDKVTATCNQIRDVLAPGAKKVTAKLYKLLMYRKGDFFCRHQDAQHSAHMFATLLFFLPVEYTGGEFNIISSNCKVKNVIRHYKYTSDNLHYFRCCDWVAFYTDVHHEVLEVKEGFRVVLNYSLNFEGSMSPSRFLPRFSHSTVEVISDYFATEDKKMLAIPLHYEYTQATLFPDFLKGIDACLFSAIGEVATPELHFVLHFDKTKVIPPTLTTHYHDDDEDYLDYFEEADHEQIFQGVFLVKHEIAKKYFEIQRESEKQLEEFEVEYQSISTKRNGEYLALLKDIKTSQQDLNLEWVVERKSGYPNEWGSTTQIRFESGKLGWLGNMTPAEEYYYLHAAIVVQANI